MSYRNKTYVAFASEDIHNYRLMTAWRANKNEPPPSFGPDVL